MDVVGSGARLRRTWPQRLLITFNCSLIAVCVLAASMVGYSYYRFGNIPRVALGGSLAGKAPGAPQNYLLVGSDSRAFVEDDQDRESFGGEGDAGPQKADTILLVRIDPKAETAAMLSFPRDLWVEIPGTGERNRINTAFQDGAAQLVETIQANFNVPIHHYAQVDFAGFRGLVDAVGGVEMYLPAPVRDYNAAEGNNPSGLNIEDTGCVTLDGQQALAYVRSRHFQRFIDGKWQADPTGDIGRIGRQQSFIASAARAALAKGLTNPAKLNQLIGVAERNLTLDEELDPQDLLRLGQRFQSLDQGALRRFRLPTEPGRTAGGALVEYLKEDEAEEILDVFRGVEGDGEVVQPSSVTVQVLNGSGREGEASEAAQALSGAGFNVGGGVGNATSTRETTTVRYAPGHEAQAELLARYLEQEPQLQEDPQLKAVDVALVTGSDYTGILQSPRETPPAPPPPAGEPPAGEPPADGAPAPDQGSEPEPEPEPEC
ncbi:MAG TPA: LCP family protein [Acidimicrobiales bacterium]|nr:LCP family protein [Acidimicrobiales bacterium]